MVTFWRKVWEVLSLLLSLSTEPQGEGRTTCVKPIPLQWTAAACVNGFVMNPADNVSVSDKSVKTSQQRRQIGTRQHHLSGNLMKSLWPSTTSCFQHMSSGTADETAMGSHRRENICIIFFCCWQNVHVDPKQWKLLSTWLWQPLCGHYRYRSNLLLFLHFTAHSGFLGVTRKDFHEERTQMLMKCAQLCTR
jgi:hypothetical protein